MSKHPLAAILLFLVTSVLTAQDEGLFSTPEEDEQKPIAESPKRGLGLDISISGTLDVRAVSTGKDRGWQKGGRGVSSYGSSDGTGKDLAFKLPRAAVEADLELSHGVSLFAQLNYDDIDDGRGANIGLVEAFVRWKPEWKNHWNLSSRTGLLIPPISLEHPESAWSTKYTVTPSAINTWIGEELRLVGMEWKSRFKVHPRAHLRLGAAPFSNNDPSGSILSWRGFALHDAQARTQSRLRTQTIGGGLAPNENFVEPFKEIDGRLGYLGFVGLDYLDTFSLDLLYFNSNADHTRIDEDHEYAWLTEFFHIAWIWKPIPGLDVLAQWLEGSTGMGAPTALGVDNDYQAFYLMASYLYKERHRFSLRYDDFEVEDLDIMPDLNASSGDAWTFAYTHYFPPHHQISFEILLIDSQRVGNEGYTPGSNPDDDQFTLNYRLTF